MSRLETLIARSQAGDRQATEALVEENAGLIWSVSRRYAGRGCEMDDLYQLGCVGFLKAVEGFDMQYGTQFSTYAVPKIAGEIRRFLRDDGTVKVSRGIKERAAAVRTAASELMNLLGREPTVTEISARTGFTAEEIATAENATAAVESIQNSGREDGFCLENILSDSQTEEVMLEKLSLRQAIGRLPDREKTVIDLRYFHGLTQQQTARIMSVSQVQVSRIEKKALELMRAFMK